MADVGSQRRVLDSITGPAEKKLLIWMAERMPAWVTPDILTGVGVLGSVVVFAGYALSRVSPTFLWLSTLGLVINWVGDSTDGTLARVRHMERPKYGFYVDHTVDVLSEGLVFLGIGVSPFVRFDVACFAYTGYLAISVLAYVRAFVDGVFKIAYSRIGPTELRILLAGVNALMFFGGVPRALLRAPALNVYDIAVGLVGIGLWIAFVLSSLKGARALADVDTRSARAEQSRETGA